MSSHIIIYSFTKIRSERTEHHQPLQQQVVSVVLCANKSREIVRMMCDHLVSSVHSAQNMMYVCMCVLFCLNFGLHEGE